MRYDLLLCDFDGTIADSGEAVHRTVAETLDELLGPDHGLTSESIGDAMTAGSTLSATMDRLLRAHGSRERPTVEAAVAHYRRIYATLAVHATRLHPGVHECLTAVRAAGVPVVVVSNKGEAALIATLEALGIAPCIALVVGERPGLAPKPAPDVFDLHVEPAFPGIDRDRVLVVGDTVADLGFARNAGLDACWVAHGHGDPVRCRALGPVCEIDGFAQLQVFLGLA